MNEVTINAVDVARDVANIHAASEQYGANQAKRDGVPAAMDRQHRDLINRATDPHAKIGLAQAFAGERVAAMLGRSKFPSQREINDSYAANKTLEAFILEGLQRLHALRSSEEVDPALSSFAGQALRELDRNLPNGFVPYDRGSIALAEDEGFAKPSINEVAAYYFNGHKTLADTVAVDQQAAASAR
ncbi:MAG: hypothetical protein ACKVOE_07360 [Rickettsiales bacterium]